MAENLGPESVGALLARGGEAVSENAFSIVRTLCNLVSADEDDPRAAELVLRALEHRDLFGGAEPIFNALLSYQGLFPYLEARDGLSERDALAVEFHRPPHLNDIVFHRIQSRIYDHLVNGRSVALSAPTSFGKSLLIDAVIAAGVYTNVLVVVPTLALIDETRRRLTERFADQWKVITHHSQRPLERNIYVLTAERVVEFDPLPPIDFFVIDEFYKLSPERDNDDRCTTLNQVLYRLLKLNKPFYLLGPNIEDVPEELKNSHHCTFIKSDYKTVASEVIRVPSDGEDIPALVDLVRGQLREPTLIFCRSPQRVGEVTRALLEAGVTAPTPDRVRPAADWLAANFHRDWTVVRALQSGIGVHHGGLPRWLGQYQVRLFNDDAIRFLVCTSTLIEGVNTKAKNVVIFDKTINRKNFDFFTFNNIRGRAGRMFQHYVGHVYLFHDPPEPELPFVHIPAVTLNETAPSALLLQAERSEVGAGARDRLDGFYAQRDLDVEVLRQNASIEPVHQLELARTLRGKPRHYWPLLNWTGFPRYEQLAAMCELIWEHFVTTGGGSVRSASQLALKLSHLRSNTNIAAMIASEERHVKFVRSPDEAVDNVLGFLRYWVSYNFPRYAIALDRIQKSVFRSLGMPPGDYTVYAAQVQHLFCDPVCVAGEEYGLPFQLSKKLERLIAGDGDLDVALQKIKNAKVQLSDPFERELLEEAQAHL